MNTPRSKLPTILLIVLNLVIILPFSALLPISLVLAAGNPAGTSGSVVMFIAFGGVLLPVLTIFCILVTIFLYISGNLKRANQIGAIPVLYFLGFMVVIMIVLMKI